jgi:hypothetical protein
MTILSPMGDVYETLLTTLASPAVFPTTESIVEVDMNALLTKTASERTTQPPIEIELLLNEAHASLLDELDDVEVSSEADVPEELPTRSHHTRAATTRQAPGSEDSFASTTDCRRRSTGASQADRVKFAPGHYYRASIQ